ncbi:MAG: peptidase C69 [Candidatus Cloacimonadota bacterium]|nr:MAG: peptidase C69 [Candidatus Cloacimonadota bacterium]
MKTLLKKAINLALSMGADYADIRYSKFDSESISVKNGQVQGVDYHSDYGVGIRVLYKGAWGFASNPDIDDAARMETVVKRAVDLAKASNKVSGDNIDLAPKSVVEDAWQSKFEIDPFKVPLEEKLELLMKCCEEMSRVGGVAITNAGLDFIREDRLYMDSEGSEISQKFVQSGGGISCISLLGGEVQQRSYPSAHRGNHNMAGYEFIKEIDLLKEAPRLGKEVIELHKAILCPSEKMDLILGGSQLVLQVHESCGHAVELDRVLGYEANFAGTSFLTLDKWKNYKYGSDKVNLVQDGTTYNAIGSAKYDDEGVECSMSHLVKNGDFVGYLKSRDSAKFENGKSNGACRAQGWYNIPIVRMTNVHLLPGNETLEELISSTKRGVFMCDNRSWSIDDKRWNFQFGSELGWLIENGKITQMVKNPTYTGITPEFWGNCEGVASKKEWKIWGTPNCGKGQPMQVIRVGHGVSYAKFNDVRVGVSK